MTSSPILLIVLSLLLCGLAAAQSDGCPATEPEEWSPCGPDEANVSCNLGEAYGGDPYCWKACDGEWWTHFCADVPAPPPDNGGKGEKGGDGDERGPQKPFQCSSLADCDSCLDNPSCDGWAGGFGCYSTCSYDGDDPQSLNVADVACYDSSNGGCEAEGTNAADYQTCSEQTTCGGCTSTRKSGGGPCLCFANYFDDRGGGFCTNQRGMLCCPVDSCPAAATEDTVADNTGAVVEDESVLGDLTRDCQGYIAALVVCSSSSQEPACEGFDFEALLAGDLPVPANCEEADEVVCSALAGCCDKEIADIAACAAKSSLGLDCDIDCGGDGPDATSSGMKTTTSGLLGLLIAIGGALVGRTV